MIFTLSSLKQPRAKARGTWMKGMTVTSVFSPALAVPAVEREKILVSLPLNGVRGENPGNSFVPIPLSCRLARHETTKGSWIASASAVVGTRELGQGNEGRCVS